MRIANSLIGSLHLIGFRPAPGLLSAVVKFT